MRLGRAAVPTSAVWPGGRGERGFWGLSASINASGKRRKPWKQDLCDGIRAVVHWAVPASVIWPGGPGGRGKGMCGDCQLPLTRLGSAASHGSRTSATASGQSSIGQCPHLTSPLVVTWRSPAASSSLKCFAMLPSQGVQGSSSPHATRMGQLSCAAVASGLGPGSPVNTLQEYTMADHQWPAIHC